MCAKGKMPMSLDQASLPMQAIIIRKFTGLKKRDGRELKCSLGTSFPSSIPAVLVGVIFCTWLSWVSLACVTPASVADCCVLAIACSCLWLALLCLGDWGSFCMCRKLWALFNLWVWGEKASWGVPGLAVYLMQSKKKILYIHIFSFNWKLNHCNGTTEMGWGVTGIVLNTSVHPECTVRD